MTSPITTPASRTPVSPTADPWCDAQRDTRLAAITLIAIGAGALVLRVIDPGPAAAAWVVAMLGLGFLAAFAVSRRYGFLIPGGILAGLGAGIVVSQQVAGSDQLTGAVIVLGLGLGFLAVWLIGAAARAAEHHWWPLVPGGILAAIGTVLLAGDRGVAVLVHWPVGLIGLGVIVLARAWAMSRARA